MAPTLHSGDMLLTRRVSRRGAAVKPGDLVVAGFPGRPDIGLVVKRAVRADGEAWWVESDNGLVQSDSRTYGAAVVYARVVARYWPAPRLFRRPR
jgi:hypothetical protein